MKKGFDAGLALFAAILPAGFILAQSQGLEQKIWTLLDDGKAAYVSLAESDLRALGAGLDLPDGGRSITALAGKADGGAFDPRDVAGLPAQQLGYKADWIVERFRRYNLDWDLTALRLTSLILQGLKALVTRHTSGDILLIGHSTSGELSMLAYEDPDLRARLKGRYLGWGSGGPARLELLRKVRGKEIVARAGASSQAGKTPLHVLERRDPPSYARGYSGFLNPLYEAGMTHLQIAERWLAAEARRRPNFKQQLQNLEHGADLGEKAWVENEIESLLKRAGNPWRTAVEDRKSVV